jgi:hypothetical protein
MGKGSGVGQVEQVDGGSGAYREIERRTTALDYARRI